MKRNYHVLFLCLLAGMFFFACSPEQTYPSPLEGLTVGDVTVESSETEREIKVESSLKGVMATAYEVSGETLASWLTVTVSDGSLKLKLLENITVNERTARVVLSTSGDRKDISNPDLTVSFIVTQKRNSLFEDLDIEDLEIGCDRKDTLLIFDRSLPNVKATAVELSGKTAEWVSLSMLVDGVSVRVAENRTTLDRQAFIRLYSTAKDQEMSTSTAHKAFLLTQHHNPVLDNLHIDSLTLDADGAKKVVRTGRELKNIRAMVMDQDTQDKANWCRISIAGDSVVVSASALNTMSERSAIVTLYLPNNGDVIDEATATCSFVVTQVVRKNLSIDQNRVEVSYAEQQVKLKVTSNVKYQITTPGDWVECKMTPIDAITEELLLSFKENTTESVREGDLKLTSGDMEVSVHLKQSTNPAIVLSRHELSIEKVEGSFDVMVYTLTPDYKITKSSSWLEIGPRKHVEHGVYSHTVKVKAYDGLGPERKDTIVVSTSGMTDKLVVTQHKYFYLTESTKEVEIGESFQLNCTNHTGNPVKWTSSNASIAQVNNNGFVKTSYSRGTAVITASIGAYKFFTDYKDNCTVVVYDVSDKMDVARAAGDYVNEGGYVTSQCPVIVTNNLNRKVTVYSLEIKGNDGQFVQRFNCGIDLMPGESCTVGTGINLENVYKPTATVSVFDIEKHQSFFNKTVNY